MSELCRFLRWKGWYGNDTFTEAEFADHVARNEVPYSCLLSAQPWGPDDDACTPERCGSGRSCFQPSPKLVRDVS